MDATACQADPAATREHAPAPTATGVNDPVDAPVSGSGPVWAPVGPVPVVHGWREEFAEEFGEIAVEYDQDAAVVPPWWPDENSPEPRMPSTPEELEDERLYFEWLEQDVFEDPEPWQVDDGPWPDPPPESGAIPAWLYDPTRPDPIAVLAHPGPGYDPLDGPPILRTSDLGVVAVCSADPEPEPGTGTLPAITYLGIGRKHRRPGAVPPLTYRAPVLPRLPELGIGELIDRLAGHAALHGLRSDDDGHGGLTEPPPGALTYRPSARLAALVRAAYPTCVFPGCARRSCTCELDHRVPFDHRNPRAGGWTIAENLQPLCKGSHQHKTRRQWECFAVPGGIAWRSVTGIVRFTTAASFRTPAPPTDPVPEPDTPRAVAENPPLSQDETDDLVCEPTWWDRHMGENAPPPPPHDTELRARYREHRAIQQARHRLRPPPF